MMIFRFYAPIDVRYGDIDAQGHVNNARYLHYLEHTRHLFLKHTGIDFVALSEQGINLVVIRVEIDYLYPLRSGDKFLVGLNWQRISRLRFGFLQDIYRLPDHKPVVKARVIGTSINDQGKPILPEALEPEPPRRDG